MKFSEAKTLAGRIRGDVTIAQARIRWWRRGCPIRVRVDYSPTFYCEFTLAGDFERCQIVWSKMRDHIWERMVA